MPLRPRALHLRAHRLPARRLLGKRLLGKRLGGEQPGVLRVPARMLPARSSRLRAVSASTLATLVLVSLLLGEPVATDAWAGCSTACPDVGTSQGGYVGSLLLPPASAPSPASLRSDAAHCDDCVWTLEPACQRPDLTGAMCQGAARSCALGSTRMALWLRRPPDQTATRVGTFCLDPAVPLQPTALLPGVRDRFRRLVPALAPDVQPRGGGLTNLPTVFASGQPSAIGRPRFVLAGRVVDLTATTAWTWVFDDGSQLVTRRPGGPWPDLSVAHAYRRPGRYAVRVTSSWSGQFWVDGAGPFQVSGPAVTQSARLVVDVRSAAAVLVAPR